jgi:hypothetical protein
MIRMTENHKCPAIAVTMQLSKEQTVTAISRFLESNVDMKKFHKIDYLRITGIQK